MRTTTGAVLSKDIEFFIDHCLTTLSIYRHFQILFGTKSHHELLHSIAPIFFNDLNLMMRKHIILQVCQITDPEKIGNKKNLTIDYLVNYSDEALRKNLEPIAKEIHNFTKKIKSARNKIIAHLDRDTILNGKYLGAANQNDWDKFWVDLEEFMKLLKENIIVGSLSDAGSLVECLKQSNCDNGVKNA